MKFYFFNLNSCHKPKGFLTLVNTDLILSTDSVVEAERFWWSHGVEFGSRWLQRHFLWPGKIPPDQHHQEWTGNWSLYVWTPHPLIINMSMWFPASNPFHFSPQPAVLVLTPCLQSNQPSSLCPAVVAAVVAAAVVAAAVVAAAVEDLASALARLMDFTRTQPTKTTSTSATRERPMSSTVPSAWCSMTAASAATGLKQSMIRLHTGCS